MRAWSFVIASALVSCGGAAAVRTTPAPDIARPGTRDVSFDTLHGFNLLGKFSFEWSNAGYSEAEFRMIHELGFDFARLPVDYRTYVRNGDWLAFDEASLAQIDRAIEYGRRWGVHVCLNLHRGPGYTVAKPPEPRSLWTDPEAQRVFARHWEMFARRYRAVPAAALSFNLLNEPSGVSDAEYGRILRPVIEAIRAITPDRAIVVDGIDGGAKPAQSLLGLGVVHAARGYQPFGLTHYKASWVDGADAWPEPTWPPASALSAFFYGPGKPDFRSAFELDARLPAGTRVAIDVHQVSAHAVLQVRDARGEIWRHEFTPGAGPGEWSRVIRSERWNVYQNVYDRAYDVTLPAATETLAIEVIDGDWLTINRLTLDTGARVLTFAPGDQTWGSRQVVHALDAGGKLIPASAPPPEGTEILRRSLEPWLALRARGERIFVGEFGAFNQTPEHVALAWMADLMSVYRAEHVGWALWNFVGPFGILDSHRPGASYDDFEGHELDAGMLAVLKAGR